MMLDIRVEIYNEKNINFCEGAVLKRKLLLRKYVDSLTHMLLYLLNPQGLKYVHVFCQSK